MNNKKVTLFLGLLAVVILGVIVTDFLSTRPERLPDNPYKLESEVLDRVDPDMILYRETRNFRLPLQSLTGISCLGDKLYVAGDDRILVLDRRGNLLLNKPVECKPLSVKATTGKIYLGAAGLLAVLDSAANVLSLSDGFDVETILTSVDASGEYVFAADAGKRVVYRLDAGGTKQLEFDGLSGNDGNHGFIIPSPCFDLALNMFGELWVANPGKHTLENYSPEGQLRGWWKNAANDIKGFSGCCNPAHFTFLPNGNFITSEKGIIRIKEYKPSGELVGVVAPSSLFTQGGHAPDVACDEQGRVYALDPERRMIRVFERK